MEDGEVSIVGQNVEKHYSSNESRKFPVPVKIWDVEDSSSSEEEYSRRQQSEDASDMGKSNTSTMESTGKANSSNGICSGADDEEIDWLRYEVPDFDEADSLGHVGPSSNLIELTDPAMHAFEDTRTGANTQRDVEIITISSTSSVPSVQDVEDSTNNSSNMAQTTEEMMKTCKIDLSPQKMSKDMNTFPVMDECLEQVVNASADLRFFSKDVLAKFGIDLHQYKSEKPRRSSRDYKGPLESSFSERYQAVEDYLRNAYCSSAARMDVSGNPVQNVREASRGGSTVNSESNRKKKRKVYSDVSTGSSKAVECTELEIPGSLVQKKHGDIYKSSKGQSLNTDSDVKMPYVGTLSISSFFASEQDVKGPTAGSGNIPLYTVEEQSVKTEGEDEISSIGTLSSTSFVPSEQDIDNLTVSNSSSTMDTRMRKMKLVCDFLLTSAKSVAFVVVNALKSHTLCLVLLKLSETALDEGNFKTVEISMNLATQYAHLAVEAAEAAVQYHKSAASYLAEGMEQPPLILLDEGPQDGVLWQVIWAADRLEELGLLGPGVRKRVAQAEVEAVARILSPALRRVKRTDVFTKDVVEKLNKALLHKAMAVTVKGATSYTLFVISQAERMLSMLREPTGGVRDGTSARVEEAGRRGGAPKGGGSVQRAAPPSGVAEKGVRSAHGRQRGRYSS